MDCSVFNNTSGTGCVVAHTQQVQKGTSTGTAEFYGILNEKLYLTNQLKVLQMLPFKDKLGCPISYTPEGT